jgi:hypothetical protein
MAGREGPGRVPGRLIQLIEARQGWNNSLLRGCWFLWTQHSWRENQGPSLLLPLPLTDSKELIIT